jgi:type III restriction enzyme
MFKGGKTEPPPPPVDLTHIASIPDRQAAMEIDFPNVVGYRVENLDGEIKHNFSNIENYEIDGSKFPTETIMTSPISASEEKLEVKGVLEKRDQELIFLITKELIKYHFSDEEGNPRFQKFNKLKSIVEEWYNKKVLLL